MDCDSPASPVLQEPSPESPSDSSASQTLPANNNLPDVIVCGICGETHKCSECDLVEIKSHIHDSAIPTKARLTLPKNLRLETMADETYSVIADTYIKKGTQFGPLEAQRLLTLNPSIIFPLKLFNRNVEDLSEYYLDTCDENNSNWMIFVSPAQTLEEQNLMCFQDKSKIYYVAVKDIEVGNFLKVWYAPYYAIRMKKNVLTHQNPPEPYDSTVVQPIDFNILVKKQQNIMERDNWICKFCGKIETEVASFASHMIDHYSNRFLKHCEICKQTFSNKRSLQRHMNSVHAKKVNDQKITEIPRNKGKDKDMLVGGPLLNDLLTDSLDNTNLGMPNLELNQFGLPLTSTLENQNMLLESDSLSLNVDNLLTENVKELDHFNFEIDETQEQYVCDVCLKVCSKLSYLMQHFKKHTGKFTCSHCLKIFSRRENLVAHACVFEKTPKYSCSLCSRPFMLRKYLMRHMAAVHEKKFSCENCHRQYHCRNEYAEHNCPAVPDQQKITFTCHICNKTFFREVYLKKHMRTHLHRERKVSLHSFICEICAEPFSTKKGLLMHKNIHFERTLLCKICDKKFYREDVLNIHMSTHEEPKISCSVCNIKLRSKQTLTIHMRQHTGIKPYRCELCSEAFCQKSVLAAHHFKVHSKACRECNKSFETKELLAKHKLGHRMKEYFECPVCNKYFKLRSSLRRHLKQNHPDHASNDAMLDIQPKQVNFKAHHKACDMASLFNDNLLYTTENINNNVACSVQQDYNKSDIIENVNVDTHVPESDNDSLENIVNNFEDMINNFHGSTDTTSLLPASYDQIGENNHNHERILDFNDLQIDLDSNFGLQQNLNPSNQEVCLSMPDLMDTDQEITLGENAYMLDDGTIVEPKEQGNVLVYILDK